MSQVNRDSMSTDGRVVLASSLQKLPGDSPRRGPVPPPRPSGNRPTDPLLLQNRQADGASSTHASTVASTPNLTATHPPNAAFASPAASRTFSLPLKTSSSQADIITAANQNATSTSGASRLYARAPVSVHPVTERASASRPMPVSQSLSQIPTLPTAHTQPSVRGFESVTGLTPEVDVPVSHVASSNAMALAFAAPTFRPNSPDSQDQDDIHSQAPALFRAVAATSQVRNEYSEPPTNIEPVTMEARSVFPENPFPAQDPVTAAVSMSLFSLPARDGVLEKQDFDPLMPSAHPILASSSSISQEHAADAGLAFLVKPGPEAPVFTDTLSQPEPTMPQPEYDMGHDPRPVVETPPLPESDRLLLNLNAKLDEDISNYRLDELSDVSAFSDTEDRDVKPAGVVLHRDHSHDSFTDRADERLTPPPQRFQSSETAPPWPETLAQQPVPVTVPVESPPQSRGLAVPITEEVVPIMSPSAVPSVRPTSEVHTTPRLGHATENAVTVRTTSPVSRMTGEPPRTPSYHDIYVSPTALRGDLSQHPRQRDDLLFPNVSPPPSPPLRPPDRVLRDARLQADYTQQVNMWKAGVFPSDTLATGATKHSTGISKVTSPMSTGPVQGIIDSRSPAAKITQGVHSPQPTFTLGPVSVPPLSVGLPRHDTTAQPFPASNPSPHISRYPPDPHRPRSGSIPFSTDYHVDVGSGRRFSMDHVPPAGSSRQVPANSGGLDMQGALPPVNPAQMNSPVVRTAPSQQAAKTPTYGTDLGHPNTRSAAYRAPAGGLPESSFKSPRYTPNPEDALMFARTTATQLGQTGTSYVPDTRSMPADPLPIARALGGTMPESVLNERSHSSVENDTQDAQRILSPGLSDQTSPAHATSTRPDPKQDSKHTDSNVSNANLNRLTINDYFSSPNASDVQVSRGPNISATSHPSAVHMHPLPEPIDSNVPTIQPTLLPPRSSPRKLSLSRVHAQAISPSSSRESLTPSPSPDHHATRLSELPKLLLGRSASDALIVRASTRDLMEKRGQIEDKTPRDSDSSDEEPADDYGRRRSAPSKAKLLTPQYLRSRSKQVPRRDRNPQDVRPSHEINVPAAEPPEQHIDFRQSVQALVDETLKQFTEKLEALSAAYISQMEKRLKSS